jgi:hypothetical protein
MKIRPQNATSDMHSRKTPQHTNMRHIPEDAVRRALSEYGIKSIGCREKNQCCTRTNAFFMAFSYLRNDNLGLRSFRFSWIGQARSIWRPWWQLISTYHGPLYYRPGHSKKKRKKGRLRNTLPTYEKCTKSAHFCSRTAENFLILHFGQRRWYFSESTRKTACNGR